MCNSSEVRIIEIGGCIESKRRLNQAIGSWESIVSVDNVDHYGRASTYTPVETGGAPPPSTVSIYLFAGSGGFVFSRIAKGRSLKKREEKTDLFWKLKPRPVGFVFFMYVLEGLFFETRNAETTTFEF